MTKYKCVITNILQVSKEMALKYIVVHHACQYTLKNISKIIELLNDT